VHDGVPPYLRGVLEEWVNDCYPDERYESRMLHNRLKFRLRLTESELPPNRLTDDGLLNVIDALLAWWVPETSGLVGALHEILTAGGAGWRITSSGKGLERRIDATVTAAVFETVHSANAAAAKYLAASWTAAYGRNPDPDKAYDEAVLAIEAIGAPYGLPQQHSPHAGHRHPRTCATRPRSGNSRSATPQGNPLASSGWSRCWPCCGMDSPATPAAPIPAGRHRPRVRRQSTSPQPWRSG
jgi:hypothetical protein